MNTVVEQRDDAGDLLSAQYVRAVLLHDPEATSVTVPRRERLLDVMRRWENACEAWIERFDEVASGTLRAISDERTKDQIRARALVLLHAE